MELLGRSPVKPCSIGSMPSARISFTTQRPRRASSSMRSGGNGAPTPSITPQFVHDWAVSSGMNAAICASEKPASRMKSCHTFMLAVGTSADVKPESARRSMFSRHSSFP